MVVRNNEYYTQFEEILREEGKEFEYHLKMAKAYKDIYNATKNKRGLYRVLHKFAIKRNRIHYEKGYEIAKSHMVWCLEEIAHLKDYI